MLSHKHSGNGKSTCFLFPHYPEKDMSLLLLSWKACKGGEMVLSGIKKSLFFDTVINKVDAKGRVSVPAEYRAVFAFEEAEMVAFRSFTLPCIECCTSRLLQKIADEMEDSLDMFSQRQDDLSSLIFADAKEFTFDSTGRIGLTEKLLKHAGIVDAAVFVGKGKTFQIWNPQRYAEEEAAIRKRAFENRPVINLGKGLVEKNAEGKDAGKR